MRQNQRRSILSLQATLYSEPSNLLGMYVLVGTFVYSIRKAYIQTNYVLLELRFRIHHQIVLHERLNLGLLLVKPIDETTNS